MSLDPGIKENVFDDWRWNVIVTRSNTNVKRSESWLSANSIRKFHPQFASTIFNQRNIFCLKQKQKYLVLNFMSYVYS